MGMESYQITVLVKGVLIEYEDSYQKLIGSSEIDVSDVREKLRNIGAKRIQDIKWIFDDYLELYIYERNGKFQGIEIKGCISWIREGVKDSFQIINICKEWYGELDIYVLGEKIGCHSEEELGEFVQKVYEDKINFFNRQYNDIKLKVTCGNFYKEMERRSRWYYKLLFRVK